ncbi:hypothetical protein CEY08_10320 [Achromobacter insolitus]|nr:hypothetical protein CEY08_10320 [Achromobacter insolitus]
MNGNGTKNPNFSIGQGSSLEANQLGKIWVGDGAARTSDGLPGPQRIVVGKGGEMYCTADHYRTFIQINQ